MPQVLCKACALRVLVLAYVYSKRTHPSLPPKHGDLYPLHTGNGTRPPFPTRTSLHCPLSRGSVRHVIALIAPLACWLLTGQDGRQQGRAPPLPPPVGGGGRGMAQFALFPLLSARRHSGWALWFDTCASHVCSYSLQVVQASGDYLARLSAGCTRSTSVYASTTCSVYIFLQ